MLPFWRMKLYHQFDIPHKLQTETGPLFGKLHTCVNTYLQYANSIDKINLQFIPKQGRDKIKFSIDVFGSNVPPPPPFLAFPVSFLRQQIHEGWCATDEARITTIRCSILHFGCVSCRRSGIRVATLIVGACHRFLHRLDDCKEERIDATALLNNRRRRSATVVECWQQIGNKRLGSGKKPFGCSCCGR